ncbi:hypothetical protein [Phenylobacterium sp.]|uniref:hypothetical protein n=1 Tax=Phenylobacterium sp. TaxID=1871053 RepID=UPI003938E5D7
MASSIIGALAVKLGLDTAAFEAGAEKAKAGTRDLKTSLGGLATAFNPIALGAGTATSVLALFTAGLNRAVEAAQHSDDLATAAFNIGTTAEKLQELRHAGEAVDVPVDKLEGSLRSLNSTLGALRTGIGDGKIRKAFNELGIPQAALDGMNDALDLLPVLSDRIVALGNYADQVQIAKKLGVEELLPLLLKGSQGIDELRQAARDLNLVLDEETVQSMAAMNEELRVADERIAAANRRLGVEFAPTLVWIKNLAADAAGALASMFAWLNASSTVDFQIEDKLKKAQAYRERADTYRNGSSWDAYWAGGLSVPEAMSATARERRAREQEAEAARLDREIEQMVLDAERKAKEAADRAAAAAGGAAFDRKGGGDGKAKNRLSPVDLQTIDRSTIVDLGTVTKDDLVDLSGFTEGLREASRKGVMSGVNQALEGERQRITDLWRWTIQGGVSAFVEGGGKGLMKYLADTFRQRLVERVTDGIMNVIGDALKSGGGEGGGGLIRSALAIGSKIFGFASGGSGRVAGSGGPDSQLVSLALTPGELVNVTKGDAPVPGLQQTFILHAEGAVLAGELMDEMRQIGAAAAVHGELRGAARAEAKMMRRSRQRLR